ncbi:MAG TPA: CBS domain-containing protein [Solirubrobacteraceae bacterium]|jgi:CBS domain-containing protein|nr:CBS domain-containing protein [Solirubrobacteraceae bacterium]
MSETAREIMSPDAEYVGETESVTEAAEKMARLDVGALAICVGEFLETISS